MSAIRVGDVISVTGLLEKASVTSVTFGPRGMVEMIDQNGNPVTAARRDLEALGVGAIGCERLRSEQVKTRA